MFDGSMKRFRSQITNEVSWGREFSASLQHGKSSWRTFWSWKVGIHFLDLQWKSHKTFYSLEANGTKHHHLAVGHLTFSFWNLSRVASISLVSISDTSIQIPETCPTPPKAVISTSHPDLQGFTACAPGNFGSDVDPNDKTLDVESFFTAGGWHSCKPTILHQHNSCHLAKNSSGQKRGLGNGWNHGNPMNSSLQIGQMQPGPFLFLRSVQLFLCVGCFFVRGETCLCDVDNLRRSWRSPESDLSTCFHLYIQWAYHLVSLRLCAPKLG